MADSTEQNHERVEQMKSELWDIAQACEGSLKSRALAAFGSMEVLADGLHQQVLHEERMQNRFKKSTNG